MRQSQADEPAQQSQQRAFREKLADDPRPPGAHGQPHRHLFLTGGGAGEQQVGDVDAGDEEQKAHRAQEEQQRKP